MKRKGRRWENRNWERYREKVIERRKRIGLSDGRRRRRR